MLLLLFTLALGAVCQSYEPGGVRVQRQAPELGEPLAASQRSGGESLSGQIQGKGWPYTAQTLLLASDMYNVDANY